MTEIKPFYVLAIGISRAYGGSQEGGWWYDITEILRVYKAWDWKQGMKVARELKENFPTCPHGRGSSIGGMDVYIEVRRTVEDFPTEGPFGKPAYE